MVCIIIIAEVHERFADLLDDEVVRFKCLHCDEMFPTVRGAACHIFYEHGDSYDGVTAPLLPLFFLTSGSEVCCFSVGVAVVRSLR